MSSDFTQDASARPSRPEPFGRRRMIATAALAVVPTLAGMQFARTVRAAAYPERPINLIVPFAPGGGSDNVARIIATKLAERSGKTFVVSNRPGAGTNIGNAAAARSAPDGYTLLLGQFTLPVNPHLYANAGYRPEKDFVPVVHLADAPTVLIVPADSPIQDLSGLVARLRSQADKLNYGSGGAGTSVHLAGELFGALHGGRMTHVPYRGSAQAMTDLIGGRIDMMFDTSTSALPHVRSQRVRPIAVAAAHRLKMLPDVPTFAEQGIDDFEVPVWYGLVAPAGTPDASIQWLNTEVNTVLKDPEVSKLLEGMGAVPVGGTPAELGAFITAQSKRWRKLITDARITLE